MAKTGFQPPLLLFLSCVLWVGANARCPKRTDTSCTDCPAGWTYNDGFCYLFVGSEKTWADAERFCISQKANLASIQSNDEFTFLKNLIIQKGGPSRRTWIGGHDAVQDNVWMWSDGSPFTFTSWGPGEPNNTGGKEPCMEIMNAGSGYVNDEPCHRRSAFICAKNA
ncbi:galactose-specific lectin nattectin-like [Menidia menidia]